MSIVSGDSTAGVKTAVSTTAGLGSILIGIASYMPGDVGKIFSLLVPLISSAISWIGIYCYNRWMEPHAVVSWRSALRKDLKEQLAIINDKNCDEDTRLEAKSMYSKTKMRLATLRQDYASGLLNIDIAE
jgi:hypothetical protein